MRVMRKTHKFLSIILAIMMAISIIPITASAATYSGACGDNVTWTYDSSTYTLTISGTGDMYDNNPPWAKYQNNIKEIVISDGVTSIGRAAFFGLVKVTNISIPKSVKSIGELAFYGCSALTSITVDADNTVYSNDEFGVLFNKDKTTLFQYPVGNAATSYTIPDGVTTINDYAFFDCKSIVNVIFPDSLTTINKLAFGHVKNITSVTFPDSVRVIGNSAFFCCSKLKDIHFGSGLTKIEDSAFYNCTSITEITIPKSVTSLGRCVFDECFSLVNIAVEADSQYYSSDEYGVLYNKDKTILVQYPIAHNRIAYEIPYGVTTISKYAFNHSIYLSYVTFPLSVMSIEDNAFKAADNIRRIYYYGTEEQWNNIVIGDNNSDITSHTKYFECTGDEPDLGTYGDNLSYSFVYDTEDFFMNKGTLTIYGTGYMVNYDYNNQPWGEYRSKAEKVIIQEGVTSIGERAFDSFSSLKEVTIPNGVTSIGKWAFSGCNIESITIPDSVTVIDRAFYGNYYLYDVYYTGTKSQWNALLKNSDGTGLENSTIHCTDGKVYPSGRCGENVYWHFNTTTMTLVISGTGAMENYSGNHYPEPWYMYSYDIKKVVINYGVGTIGNYAFDYCPNLTDVYYTGTREQWKSIPIGNNNSPLLKATVHYNYALKYSIVITPPTCTEQGYTTYTCECGDTYVDNYVDATGHNYDSVVTPPTCTEQGYTTYTCECGDSYVDNYVDATGHNYDSVVTPPTCTEQGYTTYTCQCGDSYVDDYVDATGHTYGEWTVTKEATTDTEGEMKRVCPCGEKEYKSIDKLPVTDNKEEIENTDKVIVEALDIPNTDYNTPSPVYEVMAMLVAFVCAIAILLLIRRKPCKN